MSNLRSQFGQRLRKLRRERDLTQEQLAEAVGVSVEFLSNTERGINAPSFELYFPLKYILGTVLGHFGPFLASRSDGSYHM